MFTRVTCVVVFVLMGMNASAMLYVSPNAFRVFQDVAESLLWMLHGWDEDDEDEDEVDVPPRYVPQPIPCGQDAPTVSAYRKQVFAPFARAQFGILEDTPKEVSDFLERQFPFMQEGRLGGQWPIWQEAGKLAQGGHTHLALDWMLAMEALVLTKAPDKALELLKALEGKAEGLPNRVFLRLLAAYGTQRVKPSKEHEAALCAAATEWLREVLKDPKHSRCAKDLLENFIDFERSEIFQSYLPQIEPLDRWFFLMVRGGYAVKKAWEERGSGYANTVTQEGWKGFAEWLRAARADLEEAWRMRPELPDAAARLLAVSGGDGRDDSRMWFDRAVAAECDHKPAYQQYLWFSRPRWGGSIRAMRAFAEECYNTKRFDTFIPYYYIRVLSNVSEEVYGRWQDVFFEDGVFEKSREVLRALLEAEGFSQEEQDLHSCVLTMMYWAAGDWDAAVEANKIRQGRFNGSAVQLFGTASYYPITRLLERTGRNPPAEMTELARRCLKREFDGTQELMDALWVESVWSVPDYYSVIIPLFLIVNSGNAGWEQGLWRDLQIPDKFTGWVNFNPGFNAKGTTYVAGAQLVKLSLSVLLPENLEIECKVAFEEGTGAASFAIVLDDPTLTSQRAPVVQLTRRDGKVTASVGGEAKSVLWWNGGEPAVVNVVSKDNQISLSVNGSMVFNNQNMTRAFRPSNRDKTRGLQVRGQRCSFEGMKVRKPQAPVTPPPFF